MQIKDKLPPEPEQIRYCKGYKYQLRETAWFHVDCYPDRDLDTPLVSLTMDGLLIIRKYFAWDGCSGPTWDDSTNMRACLIHDALYYLMREGLLDRCLWRLQADNELARYMVADGSTRFRANYYRWAVNRFGRRCAAPISAREVYVAPVAKRDPGRLAGVPDNQNGPA